MTVPELGLAGTRVPKRAVSSRLRWALLGLAAIVLIAHSLAYDFVTDDAYISFVFSRNLAEHGQLAFNVGQHVEGYTNFLWTFVLGVGMLAGIGPEWSSRVLGTLCALGTLYAESADQEEAKAGPRACSFGGVPASAGALWVSAAIFGLGLARRRRAR